MTNEYGNSDNGEKRTISDSLGHLVDIRLSGNIICLEEGLRDKQFQFNKQETENLHAFLAVCLRMPRNGGRREYLENGKVLELLDPENPRITISEGDDSMEIHPASWELVLCELSLLLPRMNPSYD